VLIMRAIVALGGRAENQQIQAVINKKVKLQYNRYKAAKGLMARMGWTTIASTNRTLILSERGRAWLERQIAPPEKLDSPESTHPFNPFSPAVPSPAMPPENTRKENPSPQRISPAPQDVFIQI